MSDIKMRPEEKWAERDLSVVSQESREGVNKSPDLCPQTKKAR